MKKPSLCPGFRFHPTDVELVMYYLKKKLLGKKLEPEVIAEVKFYDFSPWDLPDKSKIRNGDLEWFFFCTKSKKYSSGSRTNRATENGYWKTTGKDREVKYKNKTVAMIKTLIFHLGHPPNGKRTDWVMHEYRMVDKDLANAGVVQEAYVLCRLFEKSGAGPKNGANYGAPFDEDEWDDDNETVLSGATMEITDPKNSSSSLTSIEPGPSIATSSENTTRVEKSTFGLFGSTNMTSTEAGPSTITFSENERHRVPPANDDVMLLHNNNTQEVEDRKGKKVMSDEDDVFGSDMITLDDLSLDGFDMFNAADGSDAFMVDPFSLDPFSLDPFSLDDLDVDLDKFV